MPTIAFEAWLEQFQPTEIAAQIFQNTATTLNFTVLTSARAAFNLAGYAVQFTAKSVATGTNLFNVACTITDAVNGLCSVALSVSDLSVAGEILSELKLFSGGNPAGDATDRIQFRHAITEVVV